MLQEHAEGEALAPPPGFTIGPCVGGLPGRTLVYAALSPDGRPCALKTLDLHASVAPVVLARFESECRLHRAADGCAGVVPLLTCASPGWLAMAWAHGGSLDTLLATDLGDAIGGVERAIGLRTIEIVRSLLQSAAALHARFIVHRDIKPSNILIDGRAIWLADFGLAGRRRTDGSWRSLDEPWTETAIGTPGWVAPELEAPRPRADPANDVYSIGRVWDALVKAQAADAPDTATHRALRARMQSADWRERPTADVAAALLSR